MNKIYLLRVIRFIILMLTTGFLHLSASVNGQKITYTAKNANLEEIVEAIKRQTGFSVLASRSTFKAARSVTIHAVDMPLEDFLVQLFHDQPLQYALGERSIVLARKAQTILQQLNIRGVVVNEKNTPLEGVTVRVKNTPRKMATDARGEYRFQNLDEDATLVFSFLGYHSLERPVSVAMDTVRMEPSSDVLDAVHVVYATGYQSIARERSAGAFAKPDLEIVLGRTATTNVLDRLEGLVPGLTHHGPGGLLIRGQSSIPSLATDSPPRTSTTPLIVVDGIEFDGDIRQLNAQDIGDITVLKDATSASIWGAKAANGVIVITTKHGQAGEKLKFDYDGYYAFQGRPDRDYVPRMTSSEFIGLSRELFPQYFPHNSVYTRVTQQYGDLPHLKIHYDHARGLLTDAQADYKLDSLSKLSNFRQIEDVFVRDAATLNQTVSVSGGSPIHTFYASLNHVGLRNHTPGEKDNQYKVNLNNHFQFGSRVSATLNADLTHRVTHTGNSFVPSREIVPYQLFLDPDGRALDVSFLGTTPFSGPMPDSLRAIYEADSRIDLAYNPVLDQAQVYGQGNRFYARMVGGVAVNILEGLDYQGTYGYNIATSHLRNVFTEEAYEMRKLVAQFAEAGDPIGGPIYHIPESGGRLNVNNVLTKAWTLRNQLHFDRAWSGHQLTIMAGQQATSSLPVTSTAVYYGWDDQLQTSRAVDMKRLTTGIPGAVMGTAILPGLNNVGGGEGRMTRTTSYFANAGYTLDRKYTLNASWRIDESNLFGRDRSAQNRPVYSIGAKWALNRETFVQPIHWLDRLDLRLTYGITGNAPFAGTAASYDILMAANNINYVTGAGFLISSPANTKLTWEATAVYNLGIDISVLRDRLSGTIDWYLRNTEDLIGTLATSPLTGYDNVIGNYGNMTNRGLDIGIQSVNIQHPHFSWSSSLIFNYNKNKLTLLHETTPATGAVMVHTERVVGYPLHTRFAYDYAGLNSEGDPQIRLADGRISDAMDAAMPEDIRYVGTAQPVWSGGLTNRFRYNSFSLSANVVFNGGHVLRSNRRPATYVQILGNNDLDPLILDRWKKPGDEARTDIPRFAPSAAIAGARNLDYYLSSEQFMLDASYVKIRDLTFSYQMPDRLASSLRARSVTCHVQLNNLLLWTANNQGMDPEFGGSVRDAQGTLSVGAHITF